MLHVGERSDDPLSPVYVPTIFAFTTSPMKRKCDKDLQRYQSAKRRREAPTQDKEPEDNSHSPHSATPLVTTAHDTCTSSGSVSTQTDLTNADIANLEKDYVDKSRQLPQVHSADTSRAYLTEQGPRKDPQLLKFYTGLTSFTVLMAIFNIVAAGVPSSPQAKLQKFQCFILTLMKLRLNTSNYDLAFRFSISTSTVGRIFIRWLEAMEVRLSFLIAWPTRDCLHKTMPSCFQVNYGCRVTSIIDCFKLFIEKPSSYLAKSCTWSQYKHYNKEKYLISVTPQGTISYISKGWGGRTSDKYIIENCGYLHYLSPGDLVLADRGFNVADSVAMQRATLNIPPFTKGCDQPPEDVEATRKLGNARIHRYYPLLEL